MRSENGKSKMLPIREVNATMEKAKAPQAANYLHLFHKKTLCKADNAAGCTPVNVIFAVKQENRGKTDSLRWLMRGFCRALEVDYYLMTDTGSKMLDSCLTKMVAYMEYMPKCAAVASSATSTSAPRRIWTGPLTPSSPTRFWSINSRS
jgi:cellulose synthase/poly-beta-1,6-N-acetylglucosamine synthase-like glycosyltransferase